MISKETCFPCSQSLNTPGKSAMRGGGGTWPEASTELDRQEKPTRGGGEAAGLGRGRVGIKKSPAPFRRRQGHLRGKLISPGDDLVNRMKLFMEFFKKSFKNHV